MNTRVEAPTQSPVSQIFGYTRARALEVIGTQALRYGVVLVLFMGWLYGVLTDQGVSRLIGSIELLTAALIAVRPASARLSAIGSALAIGTFLTTLSFLFTTPGALGATHPAHGFLLKDIVLLGAAIAIGTEALRASAEESESRSAA